MSFAATVGLGLVGSAVSAFGSHKKGQAEKAAYDYDAEIEIEKSHQEMSASEEKYSSLMGHQRMLYAAAGVDVSSGSPLLVVADTARKESIEQQRIKQGGEQKARLLRMQGQAAAQGGNIGAMSTFMGGLGQTASMFI